MSASRPAPYRQMPPVPTAPSMSLLHVIGPILPLLIVTYAFLLFPVEVRLQIAGLNLYSYRVAMLAVAPLAIRNLLNGHARLGAHDYLIGIGCIWMIVSFVQIYSPAEGLVRSFAIFLDTFGPYLIARASISSFRDIRLFLLLILPGLLVSCAFMALESLSGRLIVRPFFRSIFGSAVEYEGGAVKGQLSFMNDVRLGLLRAYGFFSFPIIGGVILASMMPLYIMSGVRGWPRYIGIGLCFAAIFAVSSAVFVALALVVALILLDVILPRFRPLNWYVVSSLVGAYAFILNFALESGVAGLIGRYTLNPMTAFARRMQWQYGAESIGRNPVFGIGFEEYERAYWMTTSIDAHFLNLGVRHGLITPLCILAGVFVLMLKLGKASLFVSRMDRNLALSLNFSIVILIFSAMTVTYFGEGNIWFMMLLGIAAAAASIPYRAALPVAYGMPVRRPGAHG